MTLFLHNEDVQNVLTMGVTLRALETAYLQLALGDAVCPPLGWGGRELPGTQGA